VGTSDGIHRGGYEASKDHVDLVEQYLKLHTGRISKADIVRSTGLTKDQVERAILTLSFLDPNLCEDDDEHLFYLP